jgi:hypothetical protein
VAQLESKVQQAFKEVREQLEVQDPKEVQVQPVPQVL